MRSVIIFTVVFLGGIVWLQGLAIERKEQDKGRSYRGYMVPRLSYDEWYSQRGLDKYDNPTLNDEPTQDTYEEYRSN